MIENQRGSAGQAREGAVRRRATLGQGVWLDYLRRDFLLQGGLRALIERDGLRGVRVTPTTFAQSIAYTGQYDAAIAEWIRRGQTDPHALYEHVAFADVQVAADLLRDVYGRSDRRDGHISVAVSPARARTTRDTVDDAIRIAAAIDRPNLVIEVACDAEGLVAQRELVTRGISINAGLIGGLTAHAAAVDAYLSGLEARAGDLESVTGVASLCVGALDDLATTDGGGRLGVAFAKLAYRQWKQLHSGRRWTALAARGARPQRLLFVPAAPGRDLAAQAAIARALVGHDTLCAMPVALLEALKGEVQAESTLEDAFAVAEATLDGARRAGTDLDALAARLTAEGIGRYRADFTALLGALERKRAEVQTGLPPLNPPRA